MGHRGWRRVMLGGALVGIAAAAIACGGGGASQAELTAAQNQLGDKETQLASAQSQLTASQSELTAAKAQITTKDDELKAVQKQLASIGPSTVVQVGQLQPAAAGTQPSGWDTAESIRGRLTLEATYDSSGPNAWDPGAHPLVYYTSEGMGYGHRPSKTNKLPGVQIIDATTKEVVASALFDLGEEVTTQPHGAGVSPDGKWFYVGFGERVKATKESKNLILIVNARTLKLDRVLSHPTQRLHHIMGFTDWQGRPRVALEMGFGSNGGPHFIVDPKDDNRVVKAITVEDTGYKIGHPYLSVDPTGKFLYVQLENAAWRDVSHEIGGIAKINLEKNTVTVIPGVGDHPIGVVHTADGKFTYVADGEGSLVYKIDDATNEVVGRTSAGVAGPYGLTLNWDETELWTMGKGEGSHNTGGVIGIIDTKTFKPARTAAYNQPVETGGAIIDHGLLHPDPKVNEIWVSSAGTWETIVVDARSKEVKARIPSPHGGDTHSGGFIRYNADFTGELLSDHGGPQKAMYAMRKDIAEKAAAKALAAP